MASSNAGFSDYQSFVPPPYEEPPRQHGCFFWGCIIAGVLSLLLLLAVGIGSFFLYRFFESVIDDYTATAPQTLPKVEMPAEARKTLKERVEAFREAIKERKPTEPLVLTSDELNALIDENEDLKGKIYVTIEEDNLKGQVSIPLGDIPSFGLTRGRFLNGEADLKASLEDGVLIVTMESIEVNGKPLPPRFVDQLRGKNLAADAYKDAKTAAEIRKLESIQIKDGKLIIKARDRTKADDAATSRDSPRIETKEGKVIVHPPDELEKKSGPPADSSPSAKKLPDEVLAPSESGPAAPAEPAKKP